VSNKIWHHLTGRSGGSTDRTREIVREQAGSGQRLMPYFILHPIWQAGVQVGHARGQRQINCHPKISGAPGGSDDVPWPCCWRAAKGSPLPVLPGAPGCPIPSLAKLGRIPALQPDRLIGTAVDLFSSLSSRSGFMARRTHLRWVQERRKRPMMQSFPMMAESWCGYPCRTPIPARGILVRRD
jgi:hypothetical protein